MTYVYKYEAPHYARGLRIRWAGHVALMGRRYRILVGKSEGKRPLERPRRRCVDNIKMDLTER
jgi:hypothetical protein